jgi:hypothetical protein
MLGAASSTLYLLFVRCRMLVELLALATTRVSLRRIDVVPGDVDHKTPFRVQTVLKGCRGTAKKRRWCISH